MESDKLIELLTKHGYSIKEEIGHGTFSKCYLCDSEKYKVPFVCKVIKIDGQANAKGYETTFYSELNALTKLMHPNVINIYDRFIEGDYYVLVLEYCSGGNLLHYIRDNGAIEPYKCIILARQILEVLTYVHSNNISHHDIKPSNIFIDKFNRVKLADFGISQIVRKDEKSTIFGGSVAYMAPEMFHKMPYNSFKSDIWAFGVTLYQMVTGGMLPFNGNNIIEMLSQICSSNYELPPGCSPQIATLLKHSLEPNVEERWSAKQLRDYLKSCESNSASSTIIPKKLRKVGSAMRPMSLILSESPPPQMSSFSPSLVIPSLHRRMRKITI